MITRRSFLMGLAVSSISMDILQIKTGKISNVSFYDKSLSIEKVKQIYESQKKFFENGVFPSVIISLGNT